MFNFFHNITIDAYDVKKTNKNMEFCNYSREIC